MNGYYQIKVLMIFLLFIMNLLYAQNTKGAPVPIFYGLNESQSNSWAQISKNGLIGISYFQHDKVNSTNGSLLYKSIKADGVEKSEVVTSGTRLENSVLLFDADSRPHIFVASSTNEDQLIYHYYKSGSSQWSSETIVSFKNEGGKFIYELSADIGPDGSFHLVVLKTRNNPDSGDYWYAYLDSYLYYLTDKSGSWNKHLINKYHTIYTMDEYSKMLNRQDLKVDKNGYAHIVYGEQVNGQDWNNSSSKLWYATNKSGNWVYETALDYEDNTRASAGWYSSLALDSLNNPHISCCYIGRVPTGSAMYAKLLYVSRTADNLWNSETVADSDDGYYGKDGRDYTGGLTHLVFDKFNKPHIVFSDIASSHAGQNYFNLGNIRYAVKEEGSWNIKKIYQQPLPKGQYNATEMYDMCLLISENSGKIQVIGQELEIASGNSYSCTFTHHVISSGTKIIPKGKKVKQVNLYNNYPNPFNPQTVISYHLPEKSVVELSVFDMLGHNVATLVNKKQNVGDYKVTFNGAGLASGIYLYKLQTNGFSEVKKMLYVQ